MLQTINNKIRRGFSESAKSYDLHSALHRDIGDKLLAQVIKEPHPSALLDVGCGTGYLTVKAKNHFSKSRIVGLDFAQGMLKVARQKHTDIVWVLADCDQLPLPDGSFDILISNLVYQWAQDLDKAFGEAGRVLTSNGVLIATLFGYNTCQELFQCLHEAKAGQLQFTRLPDETHVKQSLIQSGFKNPVVDGHSIKMQFKDMYELMSWLKSIGANNLSREGYVGREAISLAASIYREKFGLDQGVGATFEVIQVYAKK